MNNTHIHLYEHYKYTCTRAIPMCMFTKLNNFVLQIMKKKNMITLLKYVISSVHLQCQIGIYLESVLFHSTEYIQQDKHVIHFIIFSQFLIKLKRIIY